MTRKSTSNRKKRKSKKPKEKHMEPTFAQWERDSYVKRRTNWLWKLRPFIISRCEQCKTCAHARTCHRIPANERIMNKIIKTGKCPDFKSVWKKILSDEEPYDWGF